MMQYKIIRFCNIRNDAVSLDGKVIFRTSEQPGTSKQFKEIYQFCGIEYPKFYKMDMLSKLAFLAFEILTAGDGTKISETNTGILLSNRCSTIDTDKKFLQTIDPENHFPNPGVFVYTLPNVMIGEISIRKHIKGETLFISTDGFSGVAIKEALGSMEFDNCLTGFIEYESENNFEAFAAFIEKTDNSDDNQFDEELNRLYNK